MANLKLMCTSSLVVLLLGCQSDFEKELEVTNAPVIMSCGGVIELPIYIPGELQMNPEANADTSWYRGVFDQHVPSDILGYAQLPEYESMPPEYLEQRPIDGNTMPHGTHAISFHYVDGRGEMRPMDLYFNRYDNALELNNKPGHVRLGYRFWAVAPVEASHVALRLHDNPVNWRHAKNANDQIDQIEEAWYGRPADSYIRVQWQGEEKHINDVSRTSLESFKHSIYAECVASPAFESELKFGESFADDGSNWAYRDELRGQLASAQERWKRNQHWRSPAKTLDDYVEGTAVNERGTMFAFPLVALSEQEFLERVEGGDVAGSWSDDLWRQPLDLFEF